MRTYAMTAAVALAALALGGCEISNPLSNSAMGAAAETKILSYLKEYQTQQSLFQVDANGCYGSLAQLREREMVNPVLYAAWDGNAKPAPVAGRYIVSDLFAVAGISDYCSQTGICFYPASGRGGYVYCALADMEALNAPELREAAVSHGEEWTLYRGRAADFSFPLDQWPASEIASGALKARKKEVPQKTVERVRGVAGPVSLAQ